MSKSVTVWIEGPAGKLEGALREADRPRGAVVLAHPHPLYGGTMHNPVIFHADREMNRRGFATLRFNFRGVGRSDGFHDEGRGEIGDVAAAASWMRTHTPGASLVLVGYSFGSRCAVAEAIDDPAVAGVVAMGLPVRMFDFQDLPKLRRPFTVVQGTEDEFGSIEDVEAATAGMSPKATIQRIPGAPHLFPGSAAEVAEAVVTAVEAILAA